MSFKLEIEKIQDQYFEDDVHNEEEALSLSDFPIDNTIGENHEEEDKGKEENRNEVDFDFGSLAGSLSTLDSEMCSADEVFSGGRILPFRHSVSSEAGLSRSRNSTSMSVSRSESMDRRGFGSRSTNSSRSSSIRSQYSTTSTNSTTSSTISNNTSTSVKTVPVSKTRVRNNFHSHPSPKPQIWASSARSTNHTAPTGKKSTMWEVLRLGLVRTPEIELQDLKQRHRISTSSKAFIMPRNNSIGSNSNSSSNNSNNNNNKNNNNNDNNNTPIIGNKITDLLLETQKNKQPRTKINGGFFKSCKCSVMAIEPIPIKDFGVNSGNFGTNVEISQNKLSGKYQILNEDKGSVQEEQKRNKQLRQGKKVVSHHRTFEWLRDLSHASVLNS